MDVDMDNTDIFDAVDSVNHLESTYYDQGYREGFEHGKLHGLFEGRELGQEKCFDWWEELGFIEGQAMFWKRLAVAQGSGRFDGKKISTRTLKSIDQLLSLISSFPTVNPTPDTTHTTIPPPPITPPAEPSPSPTPTPTPEDDPLAEPAAAVPEGDLAGLMTRIRAKYRLVCSLVGVKPRLTVRNTAEGDVMADTTATDVVQGSSGVERVVGGSSGKLETGPAPVELKGFAKVFVEAGQHERVVIVLDKYAFSYWDDKEGSWLLEKGPFEAVVAKSSRAKDEVTRLQLTVNDTHYWNGL
ncbi:hypothetical protein QFC21_006225 [Naganishia friedmannii]|uniref:Uncharacterized protein n=1 Tax=Naganishia friedmannii TaxID=89922 RepID=A0ACC2V4B3_9TREE|nr:hypothetical protein QFC21_006225 [Naganishia friedmannii]